MFDDQPLLDVVPFGARPAVVQEWTQLIKRLRAAVDAHHDNPTELNRMHMLGDIDRDEVLDGREFELLWDWLKQKEARASHLSDGDEVGVLGERSGAQADNFLPRRLDAGDTVKLGAKVRHAL